MNKHKNPHLQNAWNKYGGDNFEFGVIEECNATRRVEREEHHKNCLNAQYNIAPIIEPFGTMNKGRKHSLATIEKMRLAHKGCKMPPWFSAFSRKMNTGRKHGGCGRTGEGNPKFAGYFIWKHVELGEERLSQMEMAKKYHLLSSNLHHLTTGKRHSHRGWVCKGKSQ